MPTRRAFALLIASVAQILIVHETPGQTDDMVTVQVRGDESLLSVLAPIQRTKLSIEPDQSSEAKELANRIPPGRAVPVLLIIVGAIAINQLLQMVVELYRQVYYGGVLIDTKEQPPRITSDPKIPANMVFVILKDGSVTQYKAESFSLNDLKGALSLR